MEPPARCLEQRFDGKRTFELFPDKLTVGGTETFSAGVEPVRIGEDQPGPLRPGV